MKLIFRLGFEHLDVQDLGLFLTACFRTRAGQYSQTVMFLNMDRPKDYLFIGYSCVSFIYRCVFLTKIFIFTCLKDALIRIRKLIATILSAIGKRKVLLTPLYCLEG